MCGRRRLGDGSQPAVTLGCTSGPGGPLPPKPGFGDTHPFDKPNQSAPRRTLVRLVDHAGGLIGRALTCLGVRPNLPICRLEAGRG